MFNCCNIKQKLSPVNIYNMGVCCVCNCKHIYKGKQKIKPKAAKIVFKQLKESFCSIIQAMPKQACLTPKNTGGSWHYYKNNKEYFFYGDGRTKKTPCKTELKVYSI